MNNYNNMSLDEKKLFDIFSQVMNEVGSYNPLNVGNDLNGGCLIHKEDNMWILSLRDNGNIKVFRRYTNLYNLCLDIIRKMDDEKRTSCLNLFIANVIIPSDTEVLIFKRNKDYEFDETNYIKGRIINKETNEIWIHGSAFKNNTYIVEGEDGNIYTCKYGNNYNGYFFKTFEDYIGHIMYLIGCNNKKIEEIKKENKEYRELLSDLINKHNNRSKQKSK